MHTHSPDLAYTLLMREIDDFLYREADLLDERQYEAWLDLFTDDVRYWMPIRKNVAFDDLDRETTALGDVAWFDDDKDTLRRRVRQLMTGIHWAEEPVSRVSHMVSNVRLATPVTAIAEGESAVVKCKFFVYRNRLETETDFLVGRREDTLRRVDGALRISFRKILIEQGILLAKNLSVFL
jgi:3-phenylpropionate/cinnamic acid dioxygenase small subunit